MKKLSIKKTTVKRLAVKTSIRSGMGTLRPSPTAGPTNAPTS